MFGLLLWGKTSNGPYCLYNYIWIPIEISWECERELIILSCSSKESYRAWVQELYVHSWKKIPFQVLLYDNIGKTKFSSTQGLQDILTWFHPCGGFYKYWHPMKSTSYSATLSPKCIFWTMRTWDCLNMIINILL